MTRLQSTVVLAVGFIGISTGGIGAQPRPDFSGVWRLDSAQSRMVGEDPSREYQLTWLVSHRDPEISVVANVRDSGGSQDYKFHPISHNVALAQLAALDLPQSIPDRTKIRISRGVKTVPRKRPSGSKTSKVGTSRRS